jgi:hypothetical protein
MKNSLINFHFLFKDHILFVFLWISLWGLFEMAIEYLTGDKKMLRILLLFTIFIFAAQAITRLETDVVKEIVKEIKTQAE